MFQSISRPLCLSRVFQLAALTPSSARQASMKQGRTRTFPPISFPSHIKFRRAPSKVSSEDLQINAIPRHKWKLKLASAYAISNDLLPCSVALSFTRPWDWGSCAAAQLALRLLMSTHGTSINMTSELTSLLFPIF